MTREPHPTTEIEREAEDWYARFDSGLEPKDLQELEAWKNQSTHHREAFERIEHLWQEWSRPRRTGRAPDVHRKMRQIRTTRRRRRILGAALALILLGATAGWLSIRPASTLAGKPAAVVLAPDRQVLPDGTRVDLRDGAEIQILFTADSLGTRRVNLTRGEAHFEVAPDRERPFIVAAGRVEARAVGTAFSVSLDGVDIEVTVSDGRVAVTSLGPTPGEAAAPILAQAGERIVVPAAPTQTQASEIKLVAVPVSPTELKSSLDWREPRVEFSRVPLEEVVRVVNRYSRTPFRIEDARLNTVPLSGVFPASDPEILTRALRSHFGIEAEIHPGREIILRRSP